MPAVYFILGLPGAGRHEVLRDLIDGGLAEGETAVVYHAAGDEPAEAARVQAPGKATLAPYAWTAGRMELQGEEAPEAAAVFVLADARASPIDQLEALPGWLAERGWKLTRVLLVVHCTLAAAHEEVVEWHMACAHFTDCVLLNRREGVANAWVSEFRRKFTAGFYPCLVVLVKGGRVENAPLLLFPESRRLSLVFDELDPLDTLELDEDDLPEEPFTLENKPDPYFERGLTGQRRLPVPNVNKFLAEGGAAAPNA